MINNNYMIEDGVLTYYNAGDSETLVIPEGVMEIGDNACEENETIKKIVVPAGVLRIGTGAFKDCKALEELLIEDGLEAIGDAAFANCEMLHTVRLPQTLKVIGNGAFLACAALKTISLPSAVDLIEENAFSGCSGLADSNGFVIIRDVLYDPHFCFDCRQRQRHREHRLWMVRESDRDCDSCKCH